MVLRLVATQSSSPLAERFRVVLFDPWRGLGMSERVPRRQPLLAGRLRAGHCRDRRKHCPLSRTGPLLARRTWAGPASTRSLHRRTTLRTLWPDSVLLNLPIVRTRWTLDSSPTSSKSASYAPRTRRSGLGDGTCVEWLMTDLMLSGMDRHRYAVAARGARHRGLARVRTSKEVAALDWCRAEIYGRCGPAPLDKLELAPTSGSRQPAATGMVPTRGTSPRDQAAISGARARVTPRETGAAAAWPWNVGAAYRSHRERVPRFSETVTPSQS